MPHHREHHPEPVEGCMGCKVLGLGWQGTLARASSIAARRAGKNDKDPTRDVPVVGDTGPRAGRVVGKHTQHWTGAQDATVQAPFVQAKAGVTVET